MSTAAFNARDFTVTNGALVTEASSLPGFAAQDEIVVQGRQAARFILSYDFQRDSDGDMIAWEYRSADPLLTQLGLRIFND